MFQFKGPQYGIKTNAPTVPPNSGDSFTCRIAEANSVPFEVKYMHGKLIVDTTVNSDMSRSRTFTRFSGKCQVSGWVGASGQGNRGQGGHWQGQELWSVSNYCPFAQAWEELCAVQELHGV